MRVLYVMAHPSDRLSDERAGHVVRPRQLLAGLESLGHSTEVLEAAAGAASQGAAESYWRVKDRIPAAVALPLRDAARIAQNESFGRSLRRHVDAHRPDVLLETQVAFSTAGAQVARRTGLPLLLDDVSPAAEDEEVYDVRLRRWARARRATTLHAAALLLVTSQRLREELVEEGLPSDRVAVVPNAVPETALLPDPGAGALRARLGFSDAHVVAAYVGSFQPFHKVHLLLQALAAGGMPASVRVLAIGDGDDRPQAERLAVELGVRSRVVFAGRVPSDDVSRHLQAADLAVLPATADYTNPMKLYDYLAAGRPVVAPRQRAVLDVLGDAPAELFDVDSTAGLAAAVARLAADAQLRTALGRASLDAARTHTWTERARAVAALAEGLQRPTAARARP